jgi:hypothetical protein
MEKAKEAKPEEPRYLEQEEEKEGYSEWKSRS